MGEGLLLYCQTKLKKEYKFYADGTLLSDLKPLLKII